MSLACAAVSAHPRHAVHAAADLHGMGWNHPSFVVEELLAEADSPVDCAGSIRSEGPVQLYYDTFARRVEKKKGLRQKHARMDLTMAGVGAGGEDLGRTLGVGIGI